MRLIAAFLGFKYFLTEYLVDLYRWWLENVSLDSQNFDDFHYVLNHL